MGRVRLAREPGKLRAGLRQAGGSDRNDLRKTATDFRGRVAEQ